MEKAPGNLICRLESKIVDGKVMRKQKEISFVDQSKIVEWQSHEKAPGNYLWRKIFYGKVMKKKEGNLSRAKVIDSKSHEITGGSLLILQIRADLKQLMGKGSMTCL